MPIPNIQSLSDRVLLENMTLNISSSYPTYNDVVSGYGSNPLGYESIDALINGEVYPIVVLDPVTGDWFSAFATVSTGSGTFTIETVSVDYWSQGTAVDVDVTVIISLTVQFLNTLVPQPREVSGTSYEITNDDNRKVLRFTNGSAVTVTVSQTFGNYLNVNDFVCWLVQEGAGTVTVSATGPTTLNGGTSDVALSSQWKKAVLYPTSDYANIVLVE